MRAPPPLRKGRRQGRAQTSSPPVRAPHADPRFRPKGPSSGDGSKTDARPPSLRLLGQVAEGGDVDVIDRGAITASGRRGGVPREISGVARNRSSPGSLKGKGPSRRNPPDMRGPVSADGVPRETSGRRENTHRSSPGGLKGKGLSRGTTAGTRRRCVPLDGFRSGEWAVRSHRSRLTGDDHRRRSIEDSFDAGRRRKVGRPTSLGEERLCHPLPAPVRRSPSCSAANPPPRAKRRRMTLDERGCLRGRGCVAFSGNRNERPAFSRPRLGATRRQRLRRILQRGGGANKHGRLERAAGAAKIAHSDRGAPPASHPGPARFPTWRSVRRGGSRERRSNSIDGLGLTSKNASTPNGAARNWRVGS